MARRTAWGLFVDEDNGLTAATQVNVNMTTPYKFDLGVSGLDGYTLIRTIGTLTCRKDSPDVGMDSGAVFGISNLHIKLNFCQPQLTVEARTPSRRHYGSLNSILR